MTRIKCIECNDIIESDGNGKFAQCKCGKCYIDETQYYCRIGGNADEIEIEKDNQWYILKDYYELETPKIEVKRGEEDEKDI